jgi:hypothetical protein
MIHKSMFYMKIFFEKSPFVNLGPILASCFLGGRWTLDAYFLLITAYDDPKRYMSPRLEKERGLA